jgi:hypothetical protein
MVILGHHADDADANSAEPGGDLPLQRTMRHQLALMDPSMSACAALIRLRPSFSRCRPKYCAIVDKRGPKFARDGGFFQRIIFRKRTQFSLSTIPPNEKFPQWPDIRRRSGQSK